MSRLSGRPCKDSGLGRFRTVEPIPIRMAPLRLTICHGQYIHHTKFTAVAVLCRLRYHRRRIDLRRGTRPLVRVPDRGNSDAMRVLDNPAQRHTLAGPSLLFPLRPLMTRHIRILLRRSGDMMKIGGERRTEAYPTDGLIRLLLRYTRTVSLPHLGTSPILAHLVHLLLYQL